MSHTECMVAALTGTSRQKASPRGRGAEAAVGEAARDRASSQCTVPIGNGDAQGLPQGVAAPAW